MMLKPQADQTNGAQPQTKIIASSFWFWGGLLLLWLGSLGLRLWHLQKLPYPIFDEVYFPVYAMQYLDGNPTWEGHPPLGKYFIMTAISLLGRNPAGYRGAEAVVGSLIPILTAGLTYQLTARRWVGLLAGVLMGLDGLYLVESRFGLINVFLVASGLSGLIFLLAALRLKGASQWQRPWLLMGCGLQLGAAFAVKWNGLGFWLAVVAVLGLSWGIALVNRLWPRFALDLTSDSPNQVISVPRIQLGFLGAMLRVRWWEWLLCLVVMPLVLYVGQWIPHILLNPQRELHQGWAGIADMWQVLLALHRHILWWHSTAEVVPTSPNQMVHPYCSQWYSWPVSARSVGYYFSSVNNVLTDVHALGNPILWWCSTGAVVFLTGKALLWERLQRFNPVVAIVLIGYATNYLPWVITKRCLFIYHYMAASLFSFIALALVLQWLWDISFGQQPSPETLPQNLENSPQFSSWQRLAFTISLPKVLCLVIGLGIAASFVFFLPLWLGLPLTSPEFYGRMWFRPDIHPIPGFNWI